MREAVKPYAFFIILTPILFAEVIQGTSHVSCWLGKCGYILYALTISFYTPAYCTLVMHTRSSKNGEFTAPKWVIGHLTRALKCGFLLAGIAGMSWYLAFNTQNIFWLVISAIATNTAIPIIYSFVIHLICKYLLEVTSFFRHQSSLNEHIKTDSISIQA